MNSRDDSNSDELPLDSLLDTPLTPEEMDQFVARCAARRRKAGISDLPRRDRTPQKNAGMTPQNLRWNHSDEIAPIIEEYWTRTAFKKVQFYGSDAALHVISVGLSAHGHRKPFFQSKRDFVINTILTNQQMYCLHAAGSIILHRPAPNGRGEDWRGTGGYCVMGAEHLIQELAPLDPMMTILRIDISLIFGKLQPFLQFAESR